jgi:hypothetical protein
MKKYIIERDIPGVDQMTPDQLKGAAATSNAALAKMGPARVQWVESFVTKDKTFCVYMAEDEAAIQEHAKLSGFPANKISEVGDMISPATAG